MSAFDWLLHECAAADLRTEDVYTTLDPDKSARLIDLLRGDTAAIARLRAPWIDVPRLQARFNAAAPYLHAWYTTGVRGENRTLPACFLQRSDTAQDAGEYERVANRHSNPRLRSFTLWRLRLAPWQASCHHYFTQQYLQLVPDGDHAGIHVLGNYRRPADAQHGTPITGHRLQKWPEIWRISAATATEYLARIILHDLGHFLLPRVPLAQESIHNAIMISAAMRADVSASPTTSPVEAYFLADILDPLSFLHLETLRHAVTAVSVPDKETRRLVRVLETNRRENLYPDHNICTAWGIADTEPSAENIAHCKARLEQIMANIESTYRTFTE